MSSFDAWVWKCRDCDRLVPNRQVRLFEGRLRHYHRGWCGLIERILVR